MEECVGGVGQVSADARSTVGQHVQQVQQLPLKFQGYLIFCLKLPAYSCLNLTEERFLKLILLAIGQFQLNSILFTTLVYVFHNHSLIFSN